MAEGPLYGGQSDTFVVQSASTAPIAEPSQPRSWLDYQHPYYKKMMPRWKMTNDFYYGEVADKDVAKTYLIRRFQGEPDQAYNERVKVSDFTPHLGTLIDTLAGMLYATEDRTARKWLDDEKKGGLGDPNEEGTPAHRLAHDADGKGTAWKTLWREFTLDIINYQCMWVLIDTVGGMHYVKLIPPTEVPNWVDGPHGPIAVLMKECRDGRTTLEQAPDHGETFIKWEIGQWSRWRQTKEGLAEQLAGPENSGTYTYQNRNGTPALPIFKVELPMRRYIAWLLANKAQVLFNQESVRDFGLRIANFAKLVLGIEGGDQYEQLLIKLLKGENVIPEGKDARGGHRFINPSSEPTKNASEVLDKKVEHFWVSGFKMYEDAAAQKTATEVKQDVASGIGAFLQLLAAAVDDAENGAFYRLEQAEFSESSNKWGIASTVRSDDFSTVDLGAVLDQMKKRYLADNQAIPIGRAALIQLAKDAAQQDGLPVNKEEIEVAVDAALASKYLADLTTLGTIPAIVKARLTMRFVAALGLVKPEEMVKLADAEENKLMDVLLQQAEELANVQEQQQRREAEMPAFSGGF
jgi:hypothetical protein